MEFFKGLLLAVLISAIFWFFVIKHVYSVGHSDGVKDGIELQKSRQGYLFNKTLKAFK